MWPLGIYQAVSGMKILLEAGLTTQHSEMHLCVYFSSYFESLSTFILLLNWTFIMFLIRQEIIGNKFVHYTAA